MYLPFLMLHPCFRGYGVLKFCVAVYRWIQASSYTLKWSTDRDKDRVDLLP